MTRILTEDQRYLIEKYGRAVLHMHRQFQEERRRLTPVLGAGIGKPLKFPGWNEFADKIATHPKLKGRSVAPMEDVHRSPAYRIQILFEHLRAELEDQEISSHGGRPLSVDLEALVEAEWQQVLRDALYSDENSSGDPSGGTGGTPRDYANLIFSTHPYLRELVEVIQHAGITVTYNFDDVIERCIEGISPRDRRGFSRGYETVVNAALPFRSEKAVIYHPNGFLPRDPLNRASGSIVLTERTFADQLLSASAGHYAFLADLLQRNTCLLLGLSLEDSTLRHLLRQNAIISPGHCHYFVRYVKDESPPDEVHRRAERTANFDTYNLVTLHLHDSQIRALLELLTMEPGRLEDFFEQAGESPRQVFFITGVPGAGKTTSVSYLSSLVTFDEWLESPPRLLSEPPDQLSEAQEAEIDKWVFDQMGEKNLALAKQDCGVFVLDRSVLDPISYPMRGIEDPVDAFRSKAEFLLQYIRPHRSPKKAMDGHVLFLFGDAAEFARRIRTRPGNWSPAKLEHLHERLTLLYPPMKGVTYIDVSRRSVGAVVKEIARVVYLLSPYTYVDMEKRLKAALEGRIARPETEP